MEEKDLTILEQHVIQINPLLEAKKFMNVTEMRLFVLGLQGVRPHITDDYGYEYDIEFRETIIPANQLTVLLGDNYGKIANIKKQLEKAYDSKIVLNYKDGGFEFKHIYDIMKYEPERGLIIKFDNKMKPYILEIVGQQYTKYKIKALFVLTSAYAWRILELLFTKQGYFKKGYQQVYIEYEVEKLREMLNVTNEYKKTTDFRKYVLDEPIAQINERTDYYVWYEKIKVGRRIKKIKIYMKLKETDKKEIAPPPPADDVEQEQTLQLTSSSAVTTHTLTKDETEEFGWTAEELEELLLNTDWANIDLWDLSEENEEKEKNEQTKLNDSNVGWTEEQQADYDMLISIEVWAKVAREIVGTYDHAHIKRNYNGVMHDRQKGTIANLPAVVVTAIKDDTYKGVEEKQKRIEREQAKRKAEWEERERAEAERQERIAKERAENERLAKIRTQYTSKKLNQILAEAKKECQKNNNIMSEDIKQKLSQYGITIQQFCMYQSIGKQFGDEKLRVGKIEKAVKKEDIKIDFVVDPNNEKTVEKIINAYYQNGRKCPEQIKKELEKQGFSWNNFEKKNIEKFVEIGKSYS